MSQQPPSLDRRRSCDRHRHRHRGCHRRRILRCPQDLVDRSNPIGLCASTTTGCSLLYALDFHQALNPSADIGHGLAGRRVLLQ